MSFTSDVKAEICLDELDDYQAKAQLCALFQVKATLHMNWQGMYVSFQMENAGIIKHIFNLVKRLYKADCRLSVLKKMQLKKNNIYRLQIFDRADEILEDLMILNDTGLHSTPPYKWVRSEKNARAYLQGCFLAGGSVNSPKTTNYHCEIAVANAQLAGAIAKQMERFYLPARVIERKSLWIVYMKAGDKIADFLRLCSASNALFQFEDSRIQRDFYNQLTRLDNCEVANEMKAFKAAREQLECIEILESNRASLRIPEKIVRVMDVRKKHPEANINELCDEMYAEYGETISKSGMKHRLSKIRTMAAPWRDPDEKKE
ncbi:DNA-binding protein WhiA [uncultured Dubosiella sp.]|jgi:hypothetical protein|uniref:DNA-binding protein WhiA n=1 Tax=uncultured Dubosiella sp. TaxID=1937011 RepID=UPI00208A8902|nr:DNA-binding protein WhiA [uncultured Dubosiella sp.]GJM57899.1 DNA-binding protein WhiA [Erysipelotrichaceae bacterium OPF54]